MTHFHSKRLPGAGRTLAAVVGLVAALVVGAAGETQAAATNSAPTAARWADRAHGFASLAGGTSGGAGGKVVTVIDQASLVKYAAAEEPYVIRVAGSIAVAPFGADVVVASDKTIIGHRVARRGQGLAVDRHERLLVARRALRRVPDLWARRASDS